MKLHEMKQKRNTIAKDMRALHEKIGDNAWTDEQRAEWNRAKAELDALDEQIAREEELRRQDQAYGKRKLTAVCSHQTRIGNLDAHLI